jgi:hypothetical protein
VRIPVIPESLDTSDERYITFDEPEKPREKGGRPANNSYRSITILCHPKTIPEAERSIKNAKLRFPASKLCGYTHNTSNWSNRQLSHAQSCKYLALKLKQKAEAALAGGSLSHMHQGIKRARTTSQSSGGSDFEAEGLALIPKSKAPVIDDEQRSVYNDVSKAGRERYNLESDLALLLF